MTLNTDAPSSLTFEGLEIDKLALNGDDFYEKLLNAHEGLNKEQSDALNARLILILSNHIGDMNILEQALNAAKSAGQTT